jgi:hypothetical protein
MVRAIGFAVACAACSYAPGHGSAGGADAADPDGQVVVDTPPPVIDTPPPAVAPCNVGVASTTGVDRGRVGSNDGGENFPPLACDNAGDRIVGLALRMSNESTVFGGRSAHGIYISCAPLSIAESGAATVGTAYLKELIGVGAPEFHWTPSTMTATTSCPAGSVISGLAAHRGEGNNRFLDVRITCAQIDHAGTVQATQVLQVAGSLTDPQNDDSESCNSGEVLVRMPNRTGQGIDAVNLSCSTPTCL